MQPKTRFVDTHCHIHSVDYPLQITEVDKHNTDAGIDYLICVGCDAADSQRAVQFVADRPNSWASVGQHPHEAKHGIEPLQALRFIVAQHHNPVLNDPEGRTLPEQLRRRSALSRPPTVSEPGDTGASAPEAQAGEDENRAEKASDHIQTVASLVPASAPSFVLTTKAGVPPRRATRHQETERFDREATAPASPGSDTGKAGNEAERRRQGSKIVAIGECGLDYFYGHSTKKDQEKALRYQIELALEYDLPLIFHVREAFDDFWPIFDDYKNIRGVLHSFTDNAANLFKAVSRGLYIGVNGIMTFTKIPDQLEVARQIPLDHLVLETDSPFLTPVPLRGKVNEPAHVLLVAKFLSDLRQISLQEIAQKTTTNARQLFSL